MNNLKKLKIAFLWHMHQPYYKDDKAKQTFMPWLFLHAIKDYYDIPWYGSKFPSIKATYNLVPSLIYQLKSYINNDANDKLIEILKKEINKLSKSEINYLESYLFSSNEKNMIKPLPRYYELYLKYNLYNKRFDFSYNELLDLEVLFLLSWCGNYLRQENNTVKILINKQNFYTQEDKILLINELLNFLPEILKFYKQLQKDGKITLSTSPYYHPIMPLLLDIKSAKEVNLNITLPKVETDFKDFGIKNIEQAISYYEEIFDTKPQGFWPAEGGVSLSTAELFCQNSIKWFCTDEEILFKTLHNYDRNNIYKNYNLKTSSGNIEVRFRDHYLSDAISFVYSKKNPKEAALDFVSHLKNIFNSCDFSPLVNVILDGENAWEFFPNNAEDFFNELYSLFEETPWLETLTMDDITRDKDILNIPITNIASGSWINGNFDIWIGSDEKNSAWELLNSTKKDFDTHKDAIDDITKELIEKEFMIALGSDWFWWYGDNHFTIQAVQFDELFRKHLINIYQYMNIPVPEGILTPIIKNNKKRGFSEQPTNFIYPKINGIKNDYFEWLNSGIIDLGKECSVMDSSKNTIDFIKYGYSKGKIYFSFIGKFENLKNNTVLKLFLDNQIFEFQILAGLQNIIEHEVKVIVFCLHDNIEVEIPLDNIIIGKEINFRFSLIENNKVIQYFPLYDDFIIKIEDLDLRNWYI